MGPTCATPHVSNAAEGEDILDPRDVMHEDLADFYITAQATTNIARCTATYNLHEIMGSRISNIEFHSRVGDDEARTRHREKKYRRRFPGCLLKIGVRG